MQGREQMRELPLRCVSPPHLGDGALDFFLHLGDALIDQARDRIRLLLRGLGLLARRLPRLCPFSLNLFRELVFGLCRGLARLVGEVLVDASLGQRRAGIFLRRVF